MKKINFFRDALRVAQKLCILSKNFIEQKSFRIEKYPIVPLKNAKKSILKFFDFLRDAAHITRKRCILSKNFIEQKSFKMKNYLLGDLRIAKFPKLEIFFRLTGPNNNRKLSYGHETQTRSAMRVSRPC
ncbi:MAG: hypothetical protein AAFX57_21020, partial [Bacteroidota bacterium]